MTKIASLMPPIRRGQIIGKVTGGPPLDERTRFWKCESCGGYFDVFDYGAVLPPPHPVEDQVQ